MARRGGGHLPVGHRLPKPEWLEPTREDIAEGERSGRPPGLSCWETAYTHLDDALWFRDLPAQPDLLPNQPLPDLPDPPAQPAQPAQPAPEAFDITVQDVLTVGSAHQRPLAVVHDAHPCPALYTRWHALDEATRSQRVRAAQGHCLIEGLRRPADLSRPQQKELLCALAARFQPHPP